MPYGFCGANSQSVGCALVGTTREQACRARVLPSVVYRLLSPSCGWPFVKVELYKNESGSKTSVCVCVERGVIAYSVNCSTQQVKCRPVSSCEQLLRLEGHANDVTAMLMLPPGVYGPTSTGERRASASCRRLLTSSMDGTLRLWDVTPDLMSLEVILLSRRCIHFSGGEISRA